MWSLTIHALVDNLISNFLRIDIIEKHETEAIEYNKHHMTKQVFRNCSFSNVVQNVFKI